MLHSFYRYGGIRLYHGDCRDILPQLSGIDYVCTDPPYGLKFMGKEWDHGVPGVRFWELIRAACKPGAMMLCFGGTRTFHRLGCAIEDAGWGIRDTIMWVYGSGLPKSHDISKAIDKAAGVEREVGEIKRRPDGTKRPNKGDWTPGSATYAQDEWTQANMATGGNHETAPTTGEAKLWDGWGTALKPAWEPIIVAMNPLDGTFANNALTHGVAGLNIDGGRVEITNPDYHMVDASKSSGFDATQHKRAGVSNHNSKGRFPANLIHDGSDEVVGKFPNSTSTGGSGPASRDYISDGRTVPGGCAATGGFGDTGSTARFFYCAKASRKERGEGNTHPTVKPLALMKYLLTLLQSPTGGVVLDPFAGSGSTLVAARELGRKAIGIELEEESCEIAEKRLGSS